MIVAVVDTNVLLSGILGYQRSASTPGEIIRLWRHGAFSLVLSPSLLNELSDTLSRPYFTQRISEEQRARALAVFRKYGQLTEISEAVKGVASDPDDDHVLAAAVSSQSDYLVTGDQPLLELGSYRGVAIISPRTFLEILLAEDGNDRGVSPRS